MRSIPALMGLVLLGAGMQACSEEKRACNLETNDGCSSGTVCERVRDGEPACFAPVEIRGRVFDLTSNDAIASARVVAIDANGASASGVATSNTEGAYTLRVPSERNADGTVIAASYTLRADAANYLSFPGGVRPAIPVAIASSGAGDAGVVVMNAITDIGLLALPEGARGSIAGRVEGSNKGGVLVVGGGSTAISDQDGSFVLFNVTPGSVTVHGFAAGVQLNPATATVTANTRTEDVVLTVSDAPLGTVSGSVSIVDAPGGSKTSVVLVVEETFNAALERGEVPRGLRVGDVSGSFTIPNVPDGQYVVLAAFENDGLVRDPDPGISGTQIVHITVPTNGNRTVTVPTAFKVTEALAVRSPGRDEPEAVTTARPMLQWADDSSEDGYEVRVFDALGNTVWEDLNLPRVNGNATVSVNYGGPDLVPGMYYQFRATSFRNRGTVHAPISRTEELRGVFYLPRP
jgi:hypothetical protein